MQRYFLSQVNKPTEDLELPKDIAHHLTTVLRAEVNTKFEIVLADEQVYLAHVTRIDDVHTFAQIDQQLDVNVVNFSSGMLSSVHEWQNKYHLLESLFLNQVVK